MLSMRGDRPHRCLKIGAHVLAWGESSKTWRGRYHYRCLVSPTPAGAIKLSPIEPNCSAQSALEERLRTLIGSPPRLQVARRVLLNRLPRPMTLVLPDLAARIVVLSLDQLPSRTEEQEALIRWKLAQEQRLPMTGAKLSWQVFPPLHAEDRSHVVFVVAAQENVLSQYESVCEAVGLMPQRVGIASVYLFNLWLRSIGGAKRLPRDLAWIAIADGGLTCLILHRGRPVFARTKLLHLDGSSQGAGATQDSVDHIVREISASLHACQEYHPGVQAKQLVLSADHEMPALGEALADELGFAVNRLDWDHVDSLGWSRDGTSLPMTALPVVAGLV